jgi:hypothetical protein
MKITKIAAAVAAGLMGVGVANATAILPNSGDGSFMFFLTDPTKGITYTDVLTQTVNSYFSASQATTPTPTGGVVNTINGDAGFSVSLASDPNLTAFLSSAGTDTLNWGIISGAYTGALGAALRPIGAARYVATSSSVASVVAVPEGAIVNQMANGIQTDVGTLNTNLGPTASSTTQGVFGTTSSSGGTNLNYYGGNITMGGILVGTSATLYGVTGNGGAAGAGYAYSLGSAIFNAAHTLTFTGNGGASVPLPAAAWLFGSGLLGLLGVSRRRTLEPV